MRYILFFTCLFLVKISSAQETVLQAKNKDNCIGIYTGFSLFENFGHIGNSHTYYQLNQSILIDPLLFFKHKKHEFVGGPIIAPYWNKSCIAGGTFSYLYHCSKKRTNLFYEANLKSVWYSVNGAVPPSSYNEGDFNSGGGVSNAKVMVMAVHTALGFEFKISKFLSGQIAVGPGYYLEHAKPGFQASYNPAYSTYDPYNTKAKDNFYKNHNGFDWYARIGLAWRIYNF